MYMYVYICNMKFSVRCAKSVSCMAAVRQTSERCGYKQRCGYKSVSCMAAVRQTSEVQNVGHVTMCHAVFFF